MELVSTHSLKRSGFFFFILQDVDIIGNNILSLVYYFFNLMPLSRGSR